MDPTALIGLAAKASDSEGGKTVARLWEQVLGPSAQVLGQALGSYTQQRVDNLAKVVKKADRKTRVRDGSVHPRVAHRILEEGSYADDEMMAEYLSGVLASGRTPDGRDDRGVSMAALVTSMSSVQVQLHFVLYRTWMERIMANDQSQVSQDSQRRELKVRADVSELSGLLGIAHDENLQARITHAFSGLLRLDLLENDWTIGPRENDDPPEWVGYITTRPTLFGFDLYGWALGLPDIPPIRVREYAGAELDASLPPALSHVLYPDA